MKNRSMQAVITSALAFAAVTFAGGASAHDQLGQLGGKKGATDIWEVSCSGGSAYLALQVKDGPPSKSPKVSVQVYKDRLAANTTDPKDGDDGYSPEIRVYGGDGVYTVLVDKTGGPPENYFLEYHCESSGNSHTGTTITQFQNQ